MIDTAIRGGEVVDGTGGARRRADIGIKAGRVVQLGTVDPAREELDASGRVVAPGFIDVHTHYDAQVWWDPTISPSSLHGVTTAISGNCGYSLAPLGADDDVDYLLRMLAVVEGMPLESLRASVPGSWRSTAEYFDRIEGSIAVNMGFLVGHSTLRRVVMGDDATKRACTPDELDEMANLLRDSLDVGGMGFSSSWSPAHYDGDGQTVPSLSATPGELIALAEVCGHQPGTSLEFIPARVDQFDDEQQTLLTTMSRQAGRPLNWNVIRITEANRAEIEHVLSAGEHARQNDAKVVALSMPIPSRARFSFGTGFVLNALPGWSEVYGESPGDHLSLLRNPDVRRRLESGANKAVGGLAEVAQWDNRVIAETFDPALRYLMGRRVDELASEAQVSAFEALIDVACRDGLRTTFSRPASEPSAADWRLSAEYWRNGLAVIGASDAGAHLDFTAYFDYPTYILEKAVREHGCIQLEEAVHLMTQVPADLYGIRDRGTITVGSHADLVVFDASEIASGNIATRSDLPTGAGRLYGEPKGIDWVLVNGEIIVQHGVITDARPGTLLRSGRDTSTPSME